MWLFGLVFGAALGAMSGGFSGGIIGGILGVVAAALHEQSKRKQAQLERRIACIEEAVGSLSERLSSARIDLPGAAGPTGTPAARHSVATEIVPESLSAEASTAAPEEAPQPKHEHDGSRYAEPAARSEQSAPAETTDTLPDWLRALLGGNILAKIGVIILFFGVASGLKLAIGMGLFPPSVRLLLGAVAAIAMVIFGYGRATQPEHRMFGITLQGGGCAILYLLVYFMLARYEMIAPTPAFVLFTLTGVGCILLAARQNGRELAMLGISGAFLAPEMASSAVSDSQIALFGYFLLLNVFIIAVNWFKNWRELNLSGFIFTLVIGMNWAFRAYRPDDFAVSETFLLLFFLLYSATPVLFNLLGAPGRAGWSDGMLLYGTPLAAAILQNRLLHDQDPTLAWNACAAGAYYLLLRWALQRRPEEETLWLEKSLLAIAIGFFTIAIPLAFNAQLTTAFWALEGFGVLHLGVRQARPLARLAGGAIQCLAGLYFLLHIGELQHDLAILNDVYIGCCIVALAALSSAMTMHADRRGSAQHAALLLYWGLLWWFAAGLDEIHRFAAPEYRTAFWLALCSASCIVLEWIGTRRVWHAMRQPGLLLLPIAALAALQGHAQHGHALYGIMAFLLPLTLAIHYGLLYRHDRDSVPSIRRIRHALAYWMLIALTGGELVWVARQLAPAVDLWPLLAWGTAGSAGILLSLYGLRNREEAGWPFAPYRDEYLTTLQYPVLPALFLWLLIGNFTHSGAGSGLPYVPLLNPFDLVQLLVLYAIWRWTCTEEDSPGLRPALYAAAFLWISMEAARLTHHWGGVPFTRHDMLASAMLQAGLSLLWTAIAMAMMIFASQHARRQLWFGGFGLLTLVGVKLILLDLSSKGTVTWTLSLIGIALLVIAASYFSPAPPKNAGEKKTEETTGTPLH